MTISSLSAEAISKIRAWQWDGVFEKHEGPETWDSVLNYNDPEFIEIAGCSVLLPVNRDQHKNITILRSIVSGDSSILTVYLKDTTHYPDAEVELFWTGRVAVCDKVPGEEFFLAIMYHEWFIIDNAPAQ